MHATAAPAAGSVVRRRRSALVVLLALVSATLTMVSVAPAATAAIDPCGVGGNKISCENSKPGTPKSVWDSAAGAGSANIQGFATQISTNPVM